MKIYSTLSSRKEDFISIDQDVSMYVCGITPYDDAHLGHAMSYIIFDVVRRYLEYKGYTVRHVQNFTDIDDKIINRALENGEDPLALAEKFMERFREEMGLLNIKPADAYPRATEEIPAIIDVIQNLIENGYAYASSGDVYYRVRNFEGYGKLSKRTLDGMRAGARIAVSDEKENPLDFTLWKNAKPNEPSWESPWGEGRPGWHIECSAMSLKYLGESLVIHGGGQDLLFPHHENEIAQSEAYTGRQPFARWWIHHGLMQMGDEKMSKSIGNLIRIREAVPLYGSDTLRLFVLGSHYRNPLSYSEDSLRSTKRSMSRLSRALDAQSTDDGAVMDSIVYQKQFEQSMDDDFNTPQATAALFEMAREINRVSGDGGNVQDAQGVLRNLLSVLGIGLEQSDPVNALEIDPLVSVLIETRSDLRKSGNYDQADQIRNRLQDIGILLEDTADGTEWRFDDTSETN